MSYEDLIELTFPENWPDEVRELSLILDVLELSSENLKALASTFPKLREEFSIPVGLEFSLKLIEQLADLLQRSPEGVFIKTGYGMFKQNPFAYAPVTTLKDFNSNVRWPDTRIEGYLRNRLWTQSAASLIFSPFHDIPPWSEFRFFIRERWSRDFGPFVKVDREMRKTIQNEETKEPLSGI